MYEKRFKELLTEMNKYRNDDSNTIIQRWELISVCNEIVLLVSEMREQKYEYVMTDSELENLQWAYAYLRTRTGK